MNSNRSDSDDLFRLLRSIDLTIKGNNTQEGLNKNDPLLPILVRAQSKLIAISKHPEVSNVRYLKLLADLAAISLATSQNSTLYLANDKTKKTTLRDYLLTKTNLQPSESFDNTQETSGSVPFNKKNLEILADLYEKIYHLADVKWVYQFQPNEESAQVMSQSIGEWQNDMMKPLAGTNALVDFKRDYTINDNPGHDETGKAFSDAEIHKMLRAYINDKAVTAYSPADEELLFEWLTHRGGGQANGNVVHDLFRNKVFSKEALNVLNAKATETNWAIHNGRLCLDYSVQYLSFMSEEKNQNTVFHLKLKTADVDNKMAAGEIRSEAPYGNVNNLATLASAKARIALTIITGQDGKKRVMPVVEKLEVTSHCELLKNPGQKKWYQNLMRK